MKHIQSIYNDVPKSKGYDKTKKIERELSDKIYTQMQAATTKRAVFNLPKGTTGANVIKALMVRHLPYTCINKHWYEVEKLLDGTRNLAIVSKWFKLYDARNISVRLKVIEIIEGLKITDKTNEYEAAKRIAEYLIDHVKYDDDEVSGYDTYFALCKELTICCGYSEAFKALCDYCGIRCQCVGSATHQWNRVNVDGKWLNVDTCWIATGSDRSKYLLTSDRVFFEYHMPIEQKMAKYWRYDGD